MASHPTLLPPAHSHWLFRQPHTEHLPRQSQICCQTVSEQTGIPLKACSLAELGWVLSQFSWKPEIRGWKWDGIRGCSLSLMGRERDSLSRERDGLRQGLAQD